MIEIVPEDPRVPGAKALLEASHALMNSLFPVGDCHFLSIDALLKPEIRFFVARKGDQILGTGAVKLVGQQGEIKSMFVDPDARGGGIAALILERLESEARGAGARWLRLETGTGLDAAHTLYYRFGFVECGPFDDYEASTYSVFMEKPLI